jgi:integrase
MARAKGSKDRCIFEEPKGSGRWLVRVYHRGHRYKRVARSKSEARALYYRIKAAIAEDRFSSQRPKPPALFDTVLETYRVAKRAEGKAVMASGIGFKRLLAEWSGRSADSITAAEVEAWGNRLSREMSPASVDLHLALLRAILRRAARDGKVEAQKIPAIVGLKKRNGRVRYLGEDEERLLIKALPAWLHALVMTAIHTGLRKGELLGLQWGDVDLHAGAITVREAKSGEIERAPLNQTVRRILSALREERMRRAKKTGDARALFGGYVFCAPRGGRVCNLQRYWYPALKSAKITDLHFHDLRHTFCSRLVMAGVDLYRVQKLARHQSPQMTMRYAHLSSGHLREAVETLDAPSAWSAVGQSVGQSGANLGHLQPSPNMDFSSI